MLLLGSGSLWGSDIFLLQRLAPSGVGKSPSGAGATPVVAKIPEERSWKGPAVLEAAQGGVAAQTGAIMLPWSGVHI